MTAMSFRKFVRSEERKCDHLIDVTKGKKFAACCIVTMLHSELKMEKNSAKNYVLYNFFADVSPLYYGLLM